MTYKSKVFPLIALLILFFGAHSVWAESTYTQNAMFDDDLKVPLPPCERIFYSLTTGQTDDIPGVDSTIIGIGRSFGFNQKKQAQIANNEAINDFKETCIEGGGTPELENPICNMTETYNKGKNPMYSWSVVARHRFEGASVFIGHCNFGEL